jgi:hypothetical protein
MITTKDDDIVFLSPFEVHGRPFMLLVSKTCYRHLIEEVVYSRRKMTLVLLGVPND